MTWTPLPPAKLSDYTALQNGATVEVRLSRLTDPEPTVVYEGPALVAVVDLPANSRHRRKAGHKGITVVQPSFGDFETDLDFDTDTGTLAAEDYLFELAPPAPGHTGTHHIDGSVCLGRACATAQVVESSRVEADAGEPLDERVTFVVQGQVVTTTNGEGDTTDWSVAAKCDKKVGTWHCATHNVTFPLGDLGAAKDEHLRTGYHIMAWLCLVDQQMEVPS